MKTSFKTRHKKSVRALFALPLLVVGSPAPAQTINSIQGTPPPGTKNDKGNIFRIVDATADAGLSGVFVVGNTHTGGGAWVDYNGDLLPDLFLSNGGGLQHRMFRNNGDGSLTDVSFLIPKPDITVEDAGVSFADLENDGDLDILVTVDNPAIVVPTLPVNPPTGGPNILYINQGDGTFVESALAAGLVHPLGRRTIDSAFADYDNDGVIDVYLVSWTPYGLPLGVHDDFDRLMKGNGDGTFTDVTAQFGTDGYGLDGLTCLWFDSDFDRYPDLFVAKYGLHEFPP